MELSPRLVPVRIPRRPDGVVLVLHGGAARREAVMVSPAQLSVVRMIPVARRAARAGGGRLAVFRLLNSRRGWDASHTPVHDAAWALDAIADRIGRRLPVCLVGHSLGGRAALLSLGAADVRSVVALAPWVLPDDRPAGVVEGRRALIVHGSRDRIASPSRSLALAHRLGTRADVAYVCVEGGKHAMLAHHRRFDGLAAQYAVWTLLGTEPRGALAAVAQGERFVTV